MSGDECIMATLHPGLSYVRPFSLGGMPSPRPCRRALVALLKNKEQTVSRRSNFGPRPRDAKTKNELVWRARVLATRMALHIQT